MEIFRRENLDHLINDGLHELIVLRTRGTDRIREFFSPSGFSRARQLGIDFDSRREMTWHVNFGYNIDPSFQRITYQTFHLFLRIMTTILRTVSHETGIYLIVIILLGKFYASLVIFVKVAPAAFLRQQRIFFHFNAPTLIVRQMQVKLVYLVERQTVYHLFQIINRKHVADYIDMKSAPIIFGSIFYIDHRKIFSTSGSEEICLFERLSQCLDSPEKSGFR